MRPVLLHLWLFWLWTFFFKCRDWQIESKLVALEIFVQHDPFFCGSVLASCGTSIDHRLRLLCRWFTLFSHIFILLTVILGSDFSCGWIILLLLRGAGQNSNFRLAKWHQCLFAGFCINTKLLHYSLHRDSICLGISVVEHQKDKHRESRNTQFMWFGSIRGIHCNNCISKWKL